MKITNVTGKEMLKLTNNEEKIKEIIEDEQFVMIESLGQVQFYKNIPATNDNNPVLCAVLKNADFTEGKGPMLLDKIFRSYDKATQYIMKNEGIYGSRQHSKNYSGVSIYGKPYCVSSFNGYEIKIVNVED